MRNMARHEEPPPSLGEVLKHPTPPFSITNDFLVVRGRAVGYQGRFIDGDGYLWYPVGFLPSPPDDEGYGAQFGNAQGGWKEVKKFKDKDGNWVTRTLWGSGKAGF